MNHRRNDKKNLQPYKVNDDENSAHQNVCHRVKAAAQGSHAALASPHSSAPPGYSEGQGHPEATSWRLGAALGPAQRQGAGASESPRSLGCSSQALPPLSLASRPWRESSHLHLAAHSCPAALHWSSATRPAAPDETFTTVSRTETPLNKDRGQGKESMERNKQNKQKNTKQLY